MKDCNIHILDENFILIGQNWDTSFNLYPGTSLLALNNKQNEKKTYL